MTDQSQPPVEFAQQLVENANKSFQGSIVLGMGFTMSPEEAEELISSDPRNADVLFPYLGGEDVNHSPTLTAPRWVINFFDWSEAQSRQYPDCFAIVENKVMPQRSTNRRKQRRELWWRYAERAPRLYSEIASLDRVLALCQTGKIQMPAFVRTGQVLAHKLVIFCFDDDFSFGVLSSGHHWNWVIRHGSTLENRPVYTPSDVFETFPQPPRDRAIAVAGGNLDTHRSQLMVERELGLTDVYNRIHDLNDRTDEDIRKLRDLHVDLDVAVRDAYGWPDLDLGHGFHEVRGQGVRFTFSSEAADEVLDRLLELNKARYEAEVAAGMHQSKRKSKAGKARTANQGSLLGDDR